MGIEERMLKDSRLAERRIIKASFYAGIADILLGLVMYFTGLHEWWFKHFHTFGVLGIGLIFYSFFHLLFYRIDRNETKKNI